MIKIGVVGFNGRVNSLIVEELLKSNELAGVLVRSGSSNNNLPFKLYESVTEFAKHVDAIIDFTNPATSLNLAKNLVGLKVALVCGTTGFTESEFAEFKAYAKSFPIIWSANMSIGINLLLSMLKIVAPVLGPDFDAGIIEVHHRHKKDSPSGTSKMLAKAIVDSGEAMPEISSLRLSQSKGDHTVIFASKDESLTLSHSVFDRNTYVKGAIEACKWGVDKAPGFYTMQDVLGGI
jgi:4-hydroxy-tetrahydrodipicolinate reductase